MMLRLQQKKNTLLEIISYLDKDKTKLHNNISEKTFYNSVN